MSDFFHTLFRDFAKPDFPQNAVMITHGMTMRLLPMRWFHYPVAEFEQLSNPLNCDIVVMELQENGKYKLVTELKKRQPAHGWKLEGS